MAGTDVGVAVAGEVNVVSNAAAQQDAVADLVPPDALRVGLEARLVPGDVRVDGDRVRGPEAGWLQWESRVAGPDAASVTGAEVSVAGGQDSRCGGRVKADALRCWRWW